MISIALVSIMVSFILADPADDMVECLEGGQDLDSCTAQTLENFRANMETGLPELGLPPIDPMTIDEIGFKFFEVNAAFTNTKLRGFKDFKLESSKVDKQKRTWNVGLFLPKMKASGSYQLAGKFPPNLDLGSSTGEERLSASDVSLTAEMKLGTRPGGKILVEELDLIPDFNNIDLELDCLFPKEGKCCPKKFLKSCNPGLAKIVLKFINQKRNFVKNFQPGITKKMAGILKDYLNKALVNLDADNVIDL